MDLQQNLLRLFIRGPRDIVGLDLGADHVKAVRLCRRKQTVHLVAAGLFPGVAEGSPVKALSLPLALRAPYAALAVEGAEAVVKLISVPGRFSEKDEENLAANLGLAPDSTHRLSYNVVAESIGRGESRILAAALPEADARCALERFPRGRPAPYSLELSGLAAMSGFAYGPGAAMGEQTVGVMDGGQHRTTFAIFHKGVPVLVRCFDFGEETVIEKVGATLGTDVKTVRGFMADGSFDISAILRQSLEPFFKQIVISKEFVERRENCRVSEILISGSLSMARGIDDVVKTFLGLNVRKWNPFSGLVAASEALPADLTGQEGRFAAAFGAAISVLELA